MLTLIENGEVYAPQHLGRAAVLVGAGKILKVGAVDKRGLERAGLEFDCLDAAHKVVLPGLIDPHEHLAGASGVGNFGSAAPPIFLHEIVAAGITTVVGTIGTDTTTYTMRGLVSRAKALNDLGITAYCYTGGYTVPPATLLDSVREDLLMASEIIGAGEVAISDERSTDPRPDELARLVSDAYIAGQLTGKAGVTHFHVGPRQKRLQLLRTLIDEHDIEPGWLYPTHVERNELLMKEALELVRRGTPIDIDVVEKDLPIWLRMYFESGADRTRCTISSDSFLTGPHNLFGQMRLCVLEHGFSLAEVLPFATSNTASVLRLGTKGRLAESMDADLLVVDRDSLTIVDVFAKGAQIVRDGKVVRSDSFLKDSDRRIELRGEK